MHEENELADLAYASNTTPQTARRAPGRGESTRATRALRRRLGWAALAALGLGFLAIWLAGPLGMKWLTLVGLLCLVVGVILGTVFGWVSRFLRVSRFIDS